jgi:hypothetical protein
MKILDSHRNNNWESHGVSFLGKNIVMNANSKLYTKLSSFTLVTIKIVGKKISGNGALRLYIKNARGEILFSQNIKLTKSSWSEQSYICNEKIANGIFEISRPKNSFGRIEIGRILLDDGIPAKVPGKKSSNIKTSSKAIEYFDFYLKNLKEISLKKKIGVIIPYGIYGGGEVYLKNIFEKTRSIFNVDFLYLSKNKLEFEMSNTNIKHKHVKNLSRMSSTLINNKARIFTNDNFKLEINFYKSFLPNIF